MKSLVQNLTTSILMDIGIDPSLIGYDCLKEAVPMVYENREYLRKLTTMLYPEVAQRLNSTASRVERAIRHSIERAFSNTDFDVLRGYFGNVICTHSGKVTNATFIAVVVERIQSEIVKDAEMREAEHYANT